MLGVSYEASKRPFGEFWNAGYSHLLRGRKNNDKVEMGGHVNNVERLEKFGNAKK